jgi:hypothetical protein
MATLTDASAKIDTVVSVLNNAFSSLEDDFETKYAAWKDTWSKGRMAFSSRYLLVIHVVDLSWRLIFRLDTKFERSSDRG